MTSPYGRSGRRESQLVEWEDFFCAIHVHISQFTSIFSRCPSIKWPRHDRAGLILRIKKQNPSASWALRQRPNGDDIVFSHPFLRTSEQRSIDHGKCEQPSNPNQPGNREIWQTVYPNCFWSRTIGASPLCESCS